MFECGHFVDGADQSEYRDAIGRSVTKFIKPYDSFAAQLSTNAYVNVAVFFFSASISVSPSIHPSSYLNNVCMAAQCLFECFLCSRIDRLTAFRPDF